MRIPMTLSPTSPLAQVLNMLIQEEEPKSPLRPGNQSPSNNFYQPRKPISLVPLKLKQRQASMPPKQPDAQNSTLMIKSSRIADPQPSTMDKDQTQDAFLVQ